jgi:hypothetical protein
MRHGGWNGKQGECDDGVEFMHQNAVGRPEIYNAVSSTAFLVVNVITALAVAFVVHAQVYLVCNHQQCYCLGSQGKFFIKSAEIWSRRDNTTGLSRDPYKRAQRCTLHDELTKHNNQTCSLRFGARPRAILFTF